MSQTTPNQARLHEIRALIAEILEIEPSDIGLTSHFKEDHGADSMRAIEIMAKLERYFEVTIPQTELERMGNLQGVYEVLEEAEHRRDSPQPRQESQ